MSTQGQPAPAAPSKKGGSKLLVLAAAGLALAGGGAVAFLKLGKKEAAHAEPERKPVVLEPGVLELEPFVLNLADPAGDRFFRLNVRIVLDQAPIARRGNDGPAQVKLRDRILAILSKKRASEMTSVEGKEALRAEIRAAAEALLGEPPFHSPDDPPPARVLEVFFTEFLVQ